MALEIKTGQQQKEEERKPEETLFYEVYGRARILINRNYPGSPEQQADRQDHFVNKLRSWLTALEDSDLEIDSENVELRLEGNEVKVVVRCDFNSTAKEKLMRANAAQGASFVTSTLSQENGSTMKMEIINKIVLKN